MPFKPSLTAFMVAVIVAVGTAPAHLARAAGNDPISAIVRLTAEVPPEATTARALGTRREGNGIVIDDSGLVLTIGYLIIEAMSVTLYDGDGPPVAADIIAYDYDTGFGLVRATRPLGVRPIELGDSSQLKESDPVLVAGQRGAATAVGAYVVSRREFAGYWEYLLENAIFTSPPHLNWGGAALIGRDGKLLGVGSLLVNNARAKDEVLPGNMFVPINLLKPIFADLLSEGQATGKVKPWLGVFAAERGGHVVILSVRSGGPAADAGIEAGDLVIDVGGKQVGSVPEFYRSVWARGEAGIEVPLRLRRAGTVRQMVVTSGDRKDYLRFSRSY